jgi:hypothetical protein
VQGGGLSLRYTTSNAASSYNPWILIKPIASKIHGFWSNDNAAE